MRRRSDNAGQRFPIGSLVQFVSFRGAPPEGFRVDSGSRMRVEEVTVGEVGIVVNQPNTSYRSKEMLNDIMNYVLVNGIILEVPCAHLRWA